MQVPLAPNADADVTLAVVTAQFVLSAVVFRDCLRMRLLDLVPCLRVNVKLLSEKDYLSGFLNVTPYFFNLVK